MSALKKAVVVIRHGQKGPNSHDKIKDLNPELPYPPPPINGCYFDKAINTPILGQSIKKLIVKCKLSLTGYEEGTSFATTIPFVMKGFQPITRAIILTPHINGNTYITAFPLLLELANNGCLKILELYSTASEIIDKITPTDNDGSILIAGNADTLNKEKPSSILSVLNDYYDKKGKELQRGRYIYVYSDNPNELKKYTQNPDKKEVTPL